ncbi:acyltransferase family protein [Chitinispirillales bacterium ANBcel5]|uniref:acyltransferase n=1 Tax=Cellulosispirillum alkaliphilum TaxID=3039283 RepID=UPI002A56A78C|nr:acyltransferase family protein [Chitinispirillales bacterium ANBcel5]
MAKSDRFLWADLLKVMAGFCVVLIHSSAPLLLDYSEVGGRVWWSANLYNSFSRWCIPVFFMISGAFLLGKAHQIKMGAFFKRRTERVFVPFLIWSWIYFLFRVFVNNEDLRFTYFPQLIIQEPVYYHLWFFYVLIMLYILAPVISAYVNKAESVNVGYFLFFWFFFASILPMLESYYDFTSLFSLTTVDGTVYYVGYFVLGYMINKVELGKGGVLLFVILFLYALFLTVYGTYDVSVVQNNGKLNQLFYEYYSFNVFIMAVSVFFIVKNVKIRSTSVAGKIITILASCIPAIFLIHAMFIALFKRSMLGFHFSETTFHPVIGVPLFALGVFGASFLVAIIIKLIPGLRRIVP